MAVAIMLVQTTDAAKFDATMRSPDTFTKQYTQHCHAQTTENTKIHSSTEHCAIYINIY